MKLWGQIGEVGSQDDEGGQIGPHIPIPQHPSLPPMLTHLSCALCGKKYDWRQLQNVCTECGRPLLARYEISRDEAERFKASLRDRPPSLWRYREMLPLPADQEILNAGRSLDTAPQSAASGPSLRSEPPLAQVQLTHS